VKILRTVVFGLVVLTPALALAKGSPIKSKKSLDSKLKSIRRDLSKRHLKLAKKLVKKKKSKQEWASWLEAKSALRADPKNKQAARILPKFEPFPPKKVNPKYTKSRAQIDLYAKQKLGSLLERGQRGNLTNDELAPVAQALLQYWTDHLKAREVLGFQGRAKKWTDQLQRNKVALYKRAMTKVAEPKDVGNQFPVLAKALGLTLIARESKHAFIVSQSQNLQSIIRVGKAADVAYAAFHKDFFGVGDLFEGAGDRATTGVKLKKLGKPVYLLLNGHTQHQVFLDKVVTDANKKVRGQKLSFVSTLFMEGKHRILVLESRMGVSHCEEWAALLMTRLCLDGRFGKGRPAYVIQGLMRYYSGQVSGRAFLKVVAGGTMSDANKELLRRGDFDQLRWTARWAYDHFRAPLPAKLGLAKALSAMNRGDLGIATAFVEFLMEKQPGLFVKFLQTADSKKKSIDAAFQEVFGKTPEEWDKAFLEWFKRRY
jgi:hypothetical protein